jgi:hypothetical protein
MSLSSSRSSSGFFLGTPGANKSTDFGFNSFVGDDPQVGDGFLDLIEKTLSSSAMEMARLKDFDRFDDVFTPPIDVIILQKLATSPKTLHQCYEECIL